jgi:hypothetical protein
MTRRSCKESMLSGKRLECPTIEGESPVHEKWVSMTGCGLSKAGHVKSCLKPEELLNPVLKLFYTALDLVFQS